MRSIDRTTAIPREEGAAHRPSAPRGRPPLRRLARGCLALCFAISAWLAPGPAQSHADELSPNLPQDLSADRAAMRHCPLEELMGERQPLPGLDALEEWRAGHPAARPLGAAGTQQDDIAVGTQLPFAVAGLPYLLSATCQHVGDHVYVFVEDASWDLNGGSILQRHVDGLADLFDHTSPADADRGVYELVVETFGPPPDVDGYERIFVLILDMPDPTWIGFFDPAVATHQVPELRRDVLHIDETALRLRSYLARGTLAHEFQHLIHWGLDEDEDLWVNEGLSGYAEAVAGYPEADSTAVPAFLERPGTDLMTWRGTPLNYGMTYLFAAHLAERYGSEAIRGLVAEARNGRAGVDEALDRVGAPGGFDEAWATWLVGNYAADDAEHGYAATQGRRVTALSVAALPLDWAGASVDGQWGSTTVVFRTPGDIEVQFRADADGVFRAWAYVMRGGSAQVQELLLDGENRGSVIAAGVDSLALVVGRTSRAGRQFEVAAAHVVIPTAVAQSNAPWAGLPGGARLGTAFPNPFNSTVRIPLRLDRPGAVQVTVTDVLGRPVRTLQAGALSAGAHELVWDGTDRTGRAAASGQYLLSLEAAPAATGARRTASGKITLIR